MDLKDLFLTPIYLLLIYAIAYRFRRKQTNKFTKKYYIPALTVKLIGAVAVGLIYYYYYGNGSFAGDTFHYYHHISILYQAFTNDPSVWLQLMLSNGEYNPDTINYASRLEWYTAKTEFTVVKIGSFISVFCFNTYLVIALFYALISFTGMWALYKTFLKVRPLLHKEFAIAVFFLPSVFFWGSGLLKDSLTIGALGWVFFGFYQAFIEKQNIKKSLFIIFLGAYIISLIKIYILLSFLPPALLWVFTENSNKIKNKLVRTVARPLIIILGIGAGYLAATGLTEGDSKYDLDKIAQTTKTNSEYLSKQVASGSAYDIGTFDGSIQSVLMVAPQAIFISLYRPFLWEVRNPVMLLSALEATLFIFLTFRFIFRTGLIRTLRLVRSNPITTFCVLFSVVLAFGVGTNSGNFGTLVRYKIPFMPFYLAAIYMMQDSVKVRRKTRKRNLQLS